MSANGKSRDMSAPSKSIHEGQTNNAPKAPSGYGVKGMASVDKDAVRSSTAPTPRTLSGRDA